MPPDIAPMLADRGIPKSLDGWCAEPKLDGWRARTLADKDDADEVRLLAHGHFRPPAAKSGPPGAIGIGAPLTYPS